MSRYKLTGRGWALAVVVAALLFVGTYALVSFAFSGEPPEDNPSGGSHLSGQTPPGQTPEATPPDVPPVTDDPPVEPSPSPEEPSPSPGVTPEPTPVPSPSPPPDDPSSPPVEPSPSPKPAEPPPERPSPIQPAPTPQEPVWVNDRVSVMFGFDSADLLEPEQYYADLAEFLPSVNELTGYLIVVSAYTAADETTEGLAKLRTETVYDMLTELGIPGPMIRLVADPVSGGTERYRQRADVYFLYVGNK